MDIDLDVLVTVREMRALAGLLGTLDRQTVAPHAFRVVVAPVGLAQADRDVLRRMAGHRPNMVVVDAAAPDTDLREALVADLVLPCRDSDRLAVDALARLLEAARGADVDAVLAKGTPERTDWQVFGADGVRRGDELDGDYTDLPVLLRRDRVGSITTDVGRTRQEGVRAATEVAVIASHVVGVAPRRPATEGRPALEVDTAWSQGVLELRHDAGGLRRAVLSAVDSGVQWQVPASEDGTTITLDLGTAALGRPLARGRWLVELHRADGEVALAGLSGPASAALLPAGPARLVVLTRHQGHLLVDVGATQRPPRRIFDPTTARVTETARGTRLEWPLQVQDFSGGAPMPVGLRLGGLPVVAELVGDGAAVELQAWLSGVPGTVRLAVNPGTGQWHQTGAELVIHNVGTMSVRRRRKKRPRKAAAAPARTSAPAGPSSRLRRLVVRTPVVGPAARSLARRLRAAQSA